MRHHVVPLDEPAVIAVRTLVRLRTVVDPAVILERGGVVGELHAADVTPYHRLACRHYLRLAVAVDRGGVGELPAAGLAP